VTEVQVEDKDELVPMPLRAGHAGRSRDARMRLSPALGKERANCGPRGLALVRSPGAFAFLPTHPYKLESGCAAR
jgi:hypothetical protein